VTTDTIVTVTPWWTPYGDRNPYKYPGWPAAPTLTPLAPPPRPPYDVPLIVTVPTITVEGPESVVTVYETVETIITRPTVYDQGYGQITQPTIVTVTDVPGRTYEPVPTITVDDTPQSAPAANSNPERASPLPTNSLEPVTVTVVVDEPPIPTGGLVQPGMGQNAPQSPSGPDKQPYIQHLTAMTIPAETISVEGQEPIYIPMSIVTVSEWPPKGAGSELGKLNGSPVTQPPAGKVVGWTAVNPEAAYTPGPSPPASSTAFYEPKASGYPGIPLFHTPIQCGPNFPRCEDETYCDPQPLCYEGCPGLCLPLYGGKYSQPLDIRNQIWDKAMSEGIYQINIRVTEVRIPKSDTTLITKAKAKKTRAGTKTV